MTNTSASAAWAHIFGKPAAAAPTIAAVPSCDAPTQAQRKPARKPAPVAEPVSRSGWRNPRSARLAHLDSLRVRIRAVRLRIGAAVIAAATVIAAPAVHAQPEYVTRTSYLGVHHPNWLATSEAPLCVSYATLHKLNSLPRARAPWMLDSAGFTQLSKHGRWTITPEQYARDAQRYMREIGQLEWAAQQDWMCEQSVLAKTGLTVAEHQRRTIENFLELRRLAPDVPWAPTLQGWTRGEYLDHIEAWYAAGVELHTLPHVAIGTVCKRTKTMLVGASLTINAIHAELTERGMRETNLHAFGCHLDLVKMVRHLIKSTDSTAWSLQARRAKRTAQKVGATIDANPNSLATALEWHATVAIPALNPDEPRPMHATIEQPEAMPKQPKTRA